MLRSLKVLALVSMARVRLSGQLGLALEDSDFLRAVVFGNRKVVAGERADDCAVGVGHVDEDADELDVDAQGQIVLSDRGRKLSNQKGGYRC